MRNRVRHETLTNFPERRGEGGSFSLENINMGKQGNSALQKFALNGRSYSETNGKKTNIYNVF